MYTYVHVHSDEKTKERKCILTTYWHDKHNQEYLEVDMHITMIQHCITTFRVNLLANQFRQQHKNRDDLVLQKAIPAHINQKFQCSIRWQKEQRPKWLEMKLVADDFEKIDKPSEPLASEAGKWSLFSGWW